MRVEKKPTEILVHLTFSEAEALRDGDEYETADAIAELIEASLPLEEEDFDIDDSDNDDDEDDDDDIFEDEPTLPAPGLDEED